MKVFEDCDYYYIYTVDFDKHYIKEYRVSDYVNGALEGVSSYYVGFPYKACGFDNPFSLLSSPDWKVEDYLGNIVTDTGEGF